MTDVAKHIDAMKREYDMAVRVEKIQSLIRGDWTGLDLTKYGDLVLEVGEMVLVWNFICTLISILTSVYTDALHITQIHLSTN